MNMRSLLRIAICGAAVMGIVSVSGTAHAASTRVSNVYGYMEHVDPDPDEFRVCDHREDGAGVTGTLYILVNGSYRWLGEVTDGGDAGCDYGQYNIYNGNTYQMEICWNAVPADGDRCKSKVLYE